MCLIAQFCSNWCKFLNYNRSAYRILLHKVFFLFQKSASSKGQLISKANCQANNSSKKMNEWIHFDYYVYIRLFLFVFWKKLKSTKSHFEINWPLAESREQDKACVDIWWILRTERKIRERFFLASSVFDFSFNNKTNFDFLSAIGSGGLWGF